MEWMGPWKGILYFQSLKDYIPAEPILLEFIPINDLGDLTGIFTERQPEKGILEGKSRQWIQRTLEGRYDQIQQKVTLWGDSRVKVEAIYFREENKWKGTFTQGEGPDFIAEIELWRDSPQPSD